MLALVSLTPIAGWAEHAYGAPQSPRAPEVRSNADTSTILLKESAIQWRVSRPQDSKQAWDETLDEHLEQVRQVYEDFFTIAKIDPVKVDTLVRLLTEEMLLTTSWSNDRMSYEPQAVDHDKAREVLAQVESIVGPEAYTELMQYRDTLPERRYLRKLVHLLATMGHPLSLEQREAMVAILTGERYRLSPGSAPEDSLEQADEIVAVLNRRDANALALFDPVLTDEQRELAKEHYARRAQRRHEALERYRKGVAEGDRPGGFLVPLE